jgi:hypothetical protein
MLENIVWAALFSVPIAVGLATMSMTPPDFSITRICFIVAAAVALGRICWWISFQHQFPSKVIFLLSITTTFFLIGLALGLGFLWVESREKISIKKEILFPSVDVELVRVKAEQPFEQFQVGFSYDIFLHNKSTAVLSQIGIMRLINPEKNKQKIAVRARSTLKLEPFSKRINVLSPDEKKLIYREMSESYEYMVITVTYMDDLDNRYKCIFEGDRDGLQLKNKQRLNHRENLIKEHEKDQKK